MGLCTIRTISERAWRRRLGHDVVRLEKYEEADESELSDLSEPEWW